MQVSLSATVQPPQHAQPTVRLAAVAREFEASFLAEMLRAAKFGAPAGNFGGGIGEDQFASFLVDAQAQQLAAGGGLGLSEMILRSLMQQQLIQSGDRP